MRTIDDGITAAYWKRVEENSTKTEVGRLLKIPHRVRWRLYMESIERLEQLSELTKEDLLKFKGIGANSVKEIEKALKVHKLKLKKG